MPASPHILILRTGNTHPSIVDEHGDYDGWFTRTMAGLDCRFQVRHVPDEGVGTLNGFDGILVSGTPASVRDEAPWMRPLAEWLGERPPGGPPVLAVCFAAQLAAAALGGRVELNPRGWEIGTIQVELTAEGRQDPLFAGLPARLQVSSTHEDHVAELPLDITLLAGNTQTPVQAFGWGSRRAVQFHPEASAGIIGRLIQLRRGVLEADARLQGAAGAGEAAKRVTALEAGLRQGPHGAAVLGNWLRYFVRQQS